MHQADPVLPPLLTGHAIKAPLQAFAEACRRASAAKLGAGDIVWSRNTARADLALILEPDVALRTALQMVALAQVALADALGQLMPPHVAVHHRWPGAVLLNGGLAGDVRAAASQCEPTDIPRWLVVGVDLWLEHDGRAGEPGHDPAHTSLAEEGAPDLTRTQVIEAFSSHFLACLNAWNDDGFRPVHDRWLFRADGREQSISVHVGEKTINVRVLGLDDEGGLLCVPERGGTRVLSLLEHVLLVADRDHNA